MTRTIDGIVTTLCFEGLVDAAPCGTTNGAKVHLTLNGRTTQCGVRVSSTYSHRERYNPRVICRSCYSLDVQA